MTCHERLVRPAAFAAALALSPLVVTAQTPRTAWGDPDLQGIWDYSSLTPMVRPQEFADQEYLSEEQAAAIEQAAIDRDRVARDAPVERSVPGSQRESIDGLDEYGRPRAHAWQWGLDFGTKVVADRRTSRIIDPPNGRFPPLTEAGAADAASRGGWGVSLPADGHLDLGQGDRCLALHGLPLQPLPYNNLVQLFQTPDHFVIYAEAFRTWRIVPISDRPHGVLRQKTGDARARWEGETLVVETTLFSNRLQQIGAGRNIRRLTERFTRESEDLVRYDYTVDDPLRWTSMWTAAISLRKTVGPMFEVACHEGNYAMENILRGLRALDGTPREPTSEPGIICSDCEAPR